MSTVASVVNSWPAERAPRVGGEPRRGSEHDSRRPARRPVGSSRCSCRSCHPCRRCWRSSRARCPKAAGLLYEPKWDGFRCIVFRDGAEVELGSRNERPLTRYFPELVESLLGNLPRSLRPRRRDRDRRARRASTSTPSCSASTRPRRASSCWRPRRRRRSSPSTCWRSATTTCAASPFGSRRAGARSGALGGAEPPVYLTPATIGPGGGQGLVLALRGRRPRRRRRQARRPHLPRGRAGHVEGQARAHGRLRRGAASGGTRTAAGSARCCSACTTRTGRFTTSAWRPASPWRCARASWTTSPRTGLEDLDGHPWEAMAPDGRRRTRRPGSPSRWNANKDLSWQALRPELVCEVGYDHLQGDRFRHATSFRRWRPDRQPALVHLRPARGRGARGARPGLRRRRLRLRSSRAQRAPPCGRPGSRSRRYRHMSSKLGPGPCQRSSSTPPSRVRSTRRVARTAEQHRRLPLGGQPGGQARGAPHGPARPRGPSPPTASGIASMWP